MLKHELQVYADLVRNSTGCWSSCMNSPACRSLLNSQGRACCASRLVNHLNEVYAGPGTGIEITWDPCSLAPKPVVEAFPVSWCAASIPPCFLTNIIGKALYLKTDSHAPWVSILQPRLTTFALGLICARDLAASSHVVFVEVFQRACAVCFWAHLSTML